jgi:hypothetical protein
LAALWQAQWEALFFLAYNKQVNEKDPWSPLLRDLATTCVLDRLRLCIIFNINISLTVQGSAFLYLSPLIISLSSLDTHAHTRHKDNCSSSKTVRFSFLRSSALNSSTCFRSHKISSSRAWRRCVDVWGSGMGEGEDDGRLVELKRRTRFSAI